MPLTRADKPDWFALTDKVKAIREMGFGSSRELAGVLSVHESRITEWICHMREAKAQKTIEIQNWIASKELAIFTAGKRPAYLRAIRKIKNG